MRNLFKTFVLLLLICMIPTGTAKAARINRKKVTTEPGKIIVLSITSQTQNAKWSSSNKKVATVSKYGIVKAKKAGKCTITGTVGSKKYTCQVTVKKKAVNVEKISLSEVNLNMKIGETKKLSVTISPYNATKKKIVFSSENSLIASVDASGHVTGVSAGETNIYASCGNKQVVCKVTVRDIEENDNKIQENTKTKETKEIYRDENIIISYVNLSQKEDEYNINFLIENLSDRTIEIQMRETSINGFMVDPLCSIEVAAKKKSNDSARIWGSDAENYPMNKVEDIQTKFHIFDWNDDDFGYDTENIMIIGDAKNEINGSENSYLKENLSKKTYITKDKFVVEYANSGNKSVYIKPSATFFDAEGNKVAVMLPENGNLIIAPLQTAYSLYEISSEEYISAETNVKFEDLNELIAYKNCLDIETIDRGNKIDCVVKNISSNTISANIVAIFKDNIGNIVYATAVINEEDSMSEFYLKSLESSITSFYKPYISYENYSIVYYAYG